MTRKVLMLSQKEILLKKKLDHHYKYFDKSKISPDPLEFPHRYKNYYDVEISAFISSVFAYGNVKQIISSLEKIHNLMDNQPYYIWLPSFAVWGNLLLNGPAYLVLNYGLKYIV